MRVPIPIDDYNHSMNSVDMASQIRGEFSVYQPSEVKWWRPILYWILDICANNAYLIWKTTQDEEDHELYKQFIDTLIEAMTNYNIHAPAPGDPLKHSWYREEKVGVCAWGRKHKGGVCPGR